MHSIVTTFRGAVIKVEVANFCAAMDTLIDQDDLDQTNTELVNLLPYSHLENMTQKRRKYDSKTC